MDAAREYVGQSTSKASFRTDVGKTIAWITLSNNIPAAFAARLTNREEGGSLKAALRK